ncbi:MAG: hypothetical protein GX951_05910 [Mollicutes bacterium]|nr:hypothetical protein [Mollicutes bacterium]
MNKKNKEEAIKTKERLNKINPIHRILVIIFSWLISTIITVILKEAFDFPLSIFTIFFFLFYYILIWLLKRNNKEVYYNKLTIETKKEDSKINIEKIKKQIKSTGTIVYISGWLTIVITWIIYIWSIFDKSLEDVSNLFGTLLIVIVSSIYVILGSRIRKLIDRNIKLYLQILLGLSFLIIFLSFLMGGSIRILLFIVIACLISSLLSINKVIDIKEIIIK